MQAQCLLKLVSALFTNKFSYLGALLNGNGKKYLTSTHSVHKLVPPRSQDDHIKVIGRRTRQTGTENSLADGA